MRHYLISQLILSQNIINHQPSITRKEKLVNVT